MKLQQFIAVSAAAFIQCAIAAPEPVNCRDVISYKPIYKGPVQCDTSYVKTWCTPVNSNEVTISNTTVKETLYGNAEPTTRKTMNLYKMVSYQENAGAGRGACTLPKTVNRELSCTATIDYSHDEEVKTRVCDYKPEVSYSTTVVFAGLSYSIMHISAQATDSDGQIASIQLWVNDVLQAGTSASLQGAAQESFRIRISATDNHGHTTERRYTVQLPPPKKCGNYYCY